MDKKCACGCGEPLDPGSKWNYLKGHKSKAAKKKKLCACGCGASLVNRHPYIKGHNPDAKKAGKKKALPKPSPPRKTIAKPAQPANGIATICVTEENLDSFWQRLSLEEKANIFQRQLEGA